MCMSIYFTNHKKKKNFPHGIFGMLLLLYWAGLAIYLWQTGFSIQELFSGAPESSRAGLLGFSMIISSFLFFFMSLGIARELKVKLKSFLYIILFLQLVMTSFLGYFFNDTLMHELIMYHLAVQTSYFLILSIYFLRQHRVYSRYFSRIIMVISALPLLPNAYFLYKAIAGINFNFTGAFLGFDNMVLYVLLCTMLLYVAVNSFYLSYINRRVF